MRLEEDGRRQLFPPRPPDPIIAPEPIVSRREGLLAPPCLRSPRRSHLPRGCPLASQCALLPRLDWTGQDRTNDAKLAVRQFPRSQALSQLFLRNEKRDDDREHRNVLLFFSPFIFCSPQHRVSSCPNFCFSVFHTRITLVAEEILLSISFCQWQISIASSPTPSFGTYVQTSPQVSLAHQPQLGY